MSEHHMSTIEAAKILRVHPRTVLRMCRRNQLRAFRFNGYAMRINSDDVLSVAATGRRADADD